MPTKNVELTSGTLYFDGVEIPVIPGSMIVEEVELVNPIEPIIPQIPEEITLTATMDYHTWLSLLLGKRVTNNWLKMHGGVMKRGRWRK